MYYKYCHWQHTTLMKLSCEFIKEDLFRHVCPRSQEYGLFILIQFITSVFPRCHTRLIPNSVVTTLVQ